MTGTEKAQVPFRGYRGWIGHRRQAEPPQDSEATVEEADWVQSLINGYRGTALVGVAARLRLADHIAGGYQSVTALAAITGTRVDRLRHVVRALSALGLLIEVDGDGLVLTRFGELLRADHPQSLRSSAAYACAVSGPAFDGLLESLSSDQTAFRHRFGTDFYTHLAGQHDVAADFNQMLAVAGLAEAVADAIDLSGVETIVDVGGGDGGLLAELLRTDGRVHGVLLDLPEILHDTSLPADPQLAARYRTQPGDFFEVVPSVGQVYLLARVLANWDEHDAAHPP
jgi:hypothetical protein